VGRSVSAGVEPAPENYLAAIQVVFKRDTQTAAESFVHTSTGDGESARIVNGIGRESNAKC
jgi:hypothetical protein